MLPHVVPACIVLACLGALPEAYSRFKPDYRELATYLDHHLTPGDAIVFCANDDEDWYCNAMYLTTAHYATSYPWPFLLLTHPAEPGLARQLQRFHSMWLINRSPRSASDLLPEAIAHEEAYFPYLATCTRVSFQSIDTHVEEDHATRLDTSHNKKDMAH